MKTSTKTPRIVRATTKLILPSQGKEIAFAHPSVGPGDYKAVGEAILAQGNRVPHGDHKASLIHAAHCIPEIHDEPEFDNVRGTMGRNWLWVFNRNLWTEDGVYVVQDSKALGGSKPLSRKGLERMLKSGREVNGIRFSKSGQVRFAPKGSYAFDSHTPESFAKDGFIIASSGIEGAEKLGEASSKFRHEIPYIYGVETDGEEQRVSALIGGGGDRLYFDGNISDDVDRCHAFGVLVK